MESPPPQPAVEWIAADLARWIFDTEDRNEQQRRFSYWCGWFGFDEDEQPETVEGRTWLIRRR